AGTTPPQEPGLLADRGDGPVTLNQALGAAESFADEAADDKHGDFGEADEVSSNGLNQDIGGQAGTLGEEVEGGNRLGEVPEDSGPGGHPTEHEPAD
ncbi:MAG: hypothetical protein AAB528_01245, partial [Chloroflexota bacterium]